MHIKQDFYCKKKCSMIYSILSPKAEEGWIKPDQCQVNSTWLELTYCIETLTHTLSSILFPYTAHGNVKNQNRDWSFFAAPQRKKKTSCIYFQNYGQPN